MVLKVISTGSVGNCYIVENDHEALLIEVGVQFKKIKQGLDFNLSKVKGAIVSHSHLDHSKSIKETMNAGINVWASEATHETCGSIMHHRACIVQEHQEYSIGGFKIKPFELMHDVPCFGFLINHSETGNFCFITDTYYVPHKLRNLHNILVEANYDPRIAKEKLGQKEFLYNRVIQSHFSLPNCIEFLKANDLSKVNNVILLHLSDGNSDEKLFKEEVTKATGKTVTVADNGLVMELNKYPF